MAEVVELSASALGVGETLNKLVQFVNVPTSTEILDGALGEVEIFRAIFIESITTIRDSASPPPESARAAVKRCQKLEQELLETLNNLGVKIYGDNSGLPIARPNSISERILQEQKSKDKLREISAAFRSTVLLLRDIAADTVTFDLLRSSHALSRTSARHNKSITTSGDGSFISTSKTRNYEFDNSTSDHQVNRGKGDVDDTNERDESGSSRIPIVAERLDLTLFNATISFVAEDGKGHWFPVRGKYDTGSEIDLLSWDTLERAGLESKLRPLENPICVTTFGAKFEFSDCITLEWQPHNSMKSYTTRFLVARREMNAPFDLLLGRDFIQKHDAINENQSFLLLKIRHKTKDQRQEEATAAERQGLVSKKLSAERREAERLERTRRRQNNAAGSQSQTNTTRSSNDYGSVQLGVGSTYSTANSTTT